LHFLDAHLKLRRIVHRELADLGMQLLDLPFTDMLGLHPDPGVERPCRILQRLLFPGINLLARRDTPTVACSRSASNAIFAFSAASIFRLAFFIIRSV
jgi:hypothetical protein